MAEIESISALRNDANIQAYYRLEDVTDEVGANDLTNNNTATFVTGHYNNGVSGGASDANKSLSIANDLGFGGGDYSVSMWVKLNTEIASGIYYFMEIADAATHNTVLLQYDYNGGTRQLSVVRVRLGVAGDTGTPYNVALGTSSWHHIVWTYNDTTNVMKLYLDGTERQSFTSSGNGSAGGTDLFVLLEGRTANDNSTLGIIDDVALFNRVLTAGEVTTISTDSIAYTKDLSETVTISEPSILRAITRTQADTVTVTDTVTKGIARIFTESALTIMERFVGRFGRASSFTQQDPEDGNWTRVS